MKHLLAFNILAIAAALPVASIAQTTNAPLTRAEVRAQTAQAEQNHTLHQSKAGYPDPEQNPSPQRPANASGYGTQTAGSTESRMPYGHVLSSGSDAGLFAHH